MMRLGTDLRLATSRLTGVRPAGRPANVCRIRHVLRPLPPVGAMKSKRDAYVKRLNGIYARNLSKDSIDLYNVRRRAACRPCIFRIICCCCCLQVYGAFSGEHEITVTDAEGTVCILSAHTHTHISWTRLLH